MIDPKMFPPIMTGPQPKKWKLFGHKEESEQPGPRLISGYDMDSGTVMLPPHIRRLPMKEQIEWAKRGGMILSPSVKGAAYSMFEMMQPFAQADAVAVTAATETILSQATILTLPANFFSFPGKVLWLHGMGKQSNVVTTPGTYTFRLRYGTGVIGDTLIVASGAIIPDPVAVTDNLFWIDLYIKALAIGPLASSLTLLASGVVQMANSDASLASDKAKYLPGGGTSLANVTGLDGTIAKTLTLTVAPTVATGSITLRDVWVVAMN